MSNLRAERTRCTEGVQQNCAEGNIWTEEGGINGRMEKIAL
jgi:hypothetical protein